MKSIVVLCLKCLERFSLTSSEIAFALCCLKCRQEIISDENFYTENEIRDENFYIANKIIKDTLSLVKDKTPNQIFSFTNQSIIEHNVPDDLIRYIYWDLEEKISERFGKESLMWGELVHAAVFVIKTSLKKALNYEQLKLERPRVLREILEQKIKRIAEIPDADRNFDIEMECLTFELSALQELKDECESQKKNSNPILKNQSGNPLLKDDKKKETSYPQSDRNKMIRSAQKLSSSLDGWTRIDLCNELHISESTLKRHMKCFNLNKKKILIEIGEI